MSVQIRPYKILQFCEYVVQLIFAILFIRFDIPNSFVLCAILNNFSPWDALENFNCFFGSTVLDMYVLKISFAAFLRSTAKTSFTAILFLTLNSLLSLSGFLRTCRMTYFCLSKCSTSIQNSRFCQQLFCFCK